MAIRGQNIVCLASQDFDDLWTRKQRWMTRLARHNRVFWVNLQMHAVTYLRRLPNTWPRVFTGGPRQVQERIWVYTPPVTFPGHQMSRTINDVHNAVLNRFLRHHLSRLGFESNILWLYTPYNPYQIGRLFDDRRVYECVDDFSAARGLIRSALVNKLETATVKQTDLVIVTSDHLADKLRAGSRQMLVSHNAADFEHFSKADDAGLPMAKELRGIDGPVIGFLGSVAYWVDVDLIAGLARSRPAWTFVLVGPVRTGIRSLAGLPNVRLIGQRPYATLPQYLKRFDVCLNPYKDDGVARGASPLKLYEYLAAGKPVVSSDMPEARRFSSVVTIARTLGEFTTAIERALHEYSAERHEEQKTIARENGWANRFAQLESRLESILGGKQNRETRPTIGSLKKLRYRHRRDTRPIIAINTLCVPHARLGGGFTYLFNLLPHLLDAAPGARFHLLVTRANRGLFPVDDDRVRLTILRDASLRGFVRTVIERFWAARWLRRIGADLYFVPYGWLPKRPPCPTVWTFQNMLLLEAHRVHDTKPTTWRRRVRDRLRRWALSNVLLTQTAKADHIIAVSETAKGEFLSQFPDCADRISAVYEGVGKEYTRQAERDEDQTILDRYGLQAPYLLSVSTLMHHKRFDSLIRAFVKFKHRSKSSDILVIAGDDWGGYRTTLEKIVKDLGAGEDVRFLGHVPPAHLPALYRHARMFVLLSTCESFGLPALEAMACGCPTIVAHTGGLAEVVARGGILLDPEDVDGLVDTLLELHASADKRSALTSAGQLRAAEFSWPAAAQQTIAVFETLLGRRISVRDRVRRPGPQRITRFHPAECKDGSTGEGPIVVRRVPRESAQAIKE